MDLEDNRIIKTRIFNLDISRYNLSPLNDKEFIFQIR